VQRSIAAAALVALPASCTTSPPRALPTPARPTTSIRPTITPTAPRDLPPLSFLVMGDWGSGAQAQRDVAREMCALRRRANPPIDVIATTGDNFYDPDGTATPRNFDEPEGCLIDDPGLVWRAAWGNHDLAGRSTGSTLGATRHYGAWRFNGALVLTLDSNDVDARQTAWLERRLRRARARVTIVLFHHPPFTAGSAHQGDARVLASWVPLFRHYDVTVVFSGHQHVYEHHVSDDVDYVVTGGGGAGLYACVRDPSTLRTCRSVYHFLLVTVDDARVTVEAITPTGDRLDRVVIRA
jgi:hypothetical protein